MNNNRHPFTGNLAAEPELNCPPKGTAVVNASLANNELYTSEDSESHKGHSASGRRFSTTCRSVQSCRHTIRAPADIMRSKAAPLFLRVAKVSEGLPRSS
jgi:hypothetical protein